MIFNLRISWLWFQRYPFINSFCKIDAITVSIWKRTNNEFIIIINFNLRIYTAEYEKLI